MSHVQAPMEHGIGEYNAQTFMTTSVASRNWLLTALKCACSSRSRTNVLICRMPARLSWSSAFMAEEAER